MGIGASVFDNFGQSKSIFKMACNVQLPLNWHKELRIVVRAGVRLMAMQSIKWV
jgi:hypothetical protein